MPYEVFWFGICVVGFVAAILFTLDSWQNIQVAARRGWYLVRLMSWGQTIAGTFFITNMFAGSYLGYLALIDDTLIRTIFVPLMVLDKLCIVLALIALWIARTRAYRTTEASETISTIQTITTKTT